MAWLRSGDLEKRSPDEHPIDYHKRLSAHVLKTIGFEKTAEGDTAAQGGPGAIVRHQKGDCGSMAILEVATMQRQGIKARNNLAAVHIFCEFYYEGVGWLNPLAEQYRSGTGASGHTIYIGGEVPVQDLSGFKHGPQMPLAAGQQPLAWKDGGMHTPNNPWDSSLMNEVREVVKAAGLEHIYFNQ